jgi:hypothetical protein
MLRHYATSRKVVDASPDAVNIFNLPNPPSHAMALWSTQPLIEIPESKGWPVHKADHLIAICEPII